MVKADHRYEQKFHSAEGKIERRRARSNHSDFNSSKVAVAAPDLATITTLAPGDIDSRQSLTISLRRRRTLLRITAPPTRREVIMPMRAVNTSSERRIPTRRRRVWDAFPWSRTRVKSPLLRRRADLGKRRRPLLGLGVSGEVDFDTFWKEAFAALLAASAQDGPACLGLHAGAETKLLFARALGRLVCAFHKIVK